ncbi:MAG TPA: hypothetical protein VHJ19_12075 [Gammaproteobacteria bacterium]|jgi:hypothetical protein|nr:hypothetical protein [Gammaproteobacteria bacterium]
MYPGIRLSGIITDLISAGLDDLESAMPYEGNRVIGQDEFGDPVHEDAGPLPRFHQLTRAHTQELQAEFTRGQSSGTK